MGKCLNRRSLVVGDLLLFEAPTSGAFDHLNCQVMPGNLTKSFQRSKMPGVCPSPGKPRAWAVLELTGTSIE